jgi:hypothetical protein
MKNLEIYNKLKTVPKECLKTIQAGRLKGMSDIKPQWRIEKMTEVFGMCGFGWATSDVYFNYKEKGDETVVNCSLKLKVKVDGEWSEPISGFGGSKFSTKERNGLYVSDEAEKMAYTDALSVAMKMLGMAADVYMGLSDSKYSGSTSTSEPKPKQQGEVVWLTEDQYNEALNWEGTRIASLLSKYNGREFTDKKIYNMKKDYKDNLYSKIK